MKVYTVTDAMEATGERDRHLVGRLIGEGAIAHAEAGRARTFDSAGFLALCRAIRDYRRDHPARPYTPRRTRGIRA